VTRQDTMINDSGSEIDKEFLDIFLDESSEILSTLNECLNHFNDPEDTHYFEKYGQHVDRLMGTAYTLSLNFIGDLSKMGKELSYKSTQLTDMTKLIVVHSLLSQLQRSLVLILKCFRHGIQPDLEEYRPLLVRLKIANESLGGLRNTLER
jgi:hypothetical protein